MYGVLRHLPRNHLSSAFGALSRLPLPRMLREPVYRAYARRYGAKLDEAELPLASYRCLAEFFTRNLRPGARTINEGVVSPVDGVLSQLGEIRGDTLVQAKDIGYSLTDLVAGLSGARLEQAIPFANRFADGFFTTLYLAPGDYHHVHSPVDAVVEATIHHPGTLWPVNGWSVARIDRLFAVNERVVSILHTEHGSLGVVMVGATNVGSITVSYSPLRTNLGIWLAGRRRPALVTHPERPCVTRGAKLGTFNLGSTVVLLFPPGRFEVSRTVQPGPVVLGQTLGSLR